MRRQDIGFLLVTDVWIKKPEAVSGEDISRQRRKAQQQRATE
jgi:hypothetical protein